MTIAKSGRTGRVELAPGLSISQVVMGLWQIADMERDGRTLDPDTTAAALAAYVDAGLTTFDMADHYGSAEEIVGSFRRRGGSGVEALTKWVPAPGAATRDQAKTAVDRALRRLQANRIDLLQFHAWSYLDPAWLDNLFYLQELREAGAIRHLGLTNFDTPHLEMALSCGIEVVSNQVSFSLLDRRPLDGMTAACERRGVGLLAYGTLAGGFLTDRYLGMPEPAPDGLSTWSEMKYKRFLDLACSWEHFQELLAVLRKIADRHGTSIANVAARWVLDQAAVAAVLIGARLGESEHIGENTALLSLSLAAQDHDEIEAVVSRFDPIPGDCGDEYRKPPFLTASGDLSHHFDEAAPPYEVVPGPDGRTRVLSGTPWEEMAGYCRALRRGRRIWVSGTTATHGDRVVAPGDPASQAHYVIDKIEAAIVSLGGRLDDVTRTRIFVNNLDDWEPVARAHGRRFRGIQPANTLVRAELIGAEYLVEMEAEAVLPH